MQRHCRGKNESFAEIYFSEIAANLNSKQAFFKTVYVSKSVKKVMKFKEMDYEKCMISDSMI